MANVYGRIHEIRSFHLQRLDRLRDMCREPRTIAREARAAMLRAPRGQTLW